MENIHQILSTYDLVETSDNHKQRYTINTKYDLCKAIKLKTFKII